MKITSAIQFQSKPIVPNVHKRNSAKRARFLHFTVEPSESCAAFRRCVLTVCFICLILFICCGLAMFSVSMQQDLLDMPLAASNYRCSGLSKLETDTGLVSDSSEQLRVFAASGVNPPQENIYATSTYLPDQNCQFLIAPKSGLVGPDGNRKIKITFSKFELENEVDFLKFYSASSADESKLVSSFTGV